MANQQKSTKKAATKAPKVAGQPKVPKYEQRESDALLNTPVATKPKK